MAAKQNSGNNRILLIQAGGTIDAAAYEDAKNPPARVETLHGENSLIPSVLTQLDNMARVDYTCWLPDSDRQFVKDSNEFSAEDIQALAEIIRSDGGHHHFLITHGTDKLCANAEMLRTLLEGSGKNVVMVGAMLPLSMNGSPQESDALPALRYALENIDSLPAEGVHVVARDAHTKRMGFHNPATAEKDRQASLEDLAFIVRSR